MNPTRIRRVQARSWLAVAVVLVAIVICYLRIAADKATEIIVYNPSGFKATQEAEGHCWTGSLAAPRAGSYRCAVDNAIFDPCFAMDDSVACPVGDPAENRGLLIRLTQPLPTPPDAWDNPPDPKNPSPWYVQLRSGGFCGVLTGTRPPEFPLGCVIPGLPEGAVCSEPVPLAHKSGIYASTCGSWDGQQLHQGRVYFVTRMWL